MSIHIISSLSASHPLPTTLSHVSLRFPSTSKRILSILPLSIYIQTHALLSLPAFHPLPIRAARRLTRSVLGSAALLRSCELPRSVMGQIMIKNKSIRRMYFPNFKNRPNPKRYTNYRPETLVSPRARLASRAASDRRQHGTDPTWHMHVFHKHN